MSIAFGLNHAAVTTPIIYSSSVLTSDIGNAGNAVLYGTTLICSLFLANLGYAVCGPKRGLVISMLCYTIYVALFAFSASQCDVHDGSNGCKEAGPLQAPLVCLGAVIGGLGAGLLWTCQGAFYAMVCEKLAVAESRPKEEVTGELGGMFGLFFLGFECAVRACTTLLKDPNFADLSYMATFLVWTASAFLATVCFAMFATNLQPSTPVQKGSVCSKLLTALRLWSDPKLWLLQSTNITFGFAAAWLAGYVSPKILKPALSSSFIGFAGAILSGLAAILSRAFAPVVRRVGKGPVLALGALAFLCLGVFSKWIGTPSEWGWGALLFYVFMGIGRAVYESTNKAIIADFFPKEKSPGAFANVFVFTTAASTSAFILGALGTTTPELYLLLAFAGLTLPSFIIAAVLKAFGERSTADASANAS